MNNVTISGNITRDPELRHTAASGVAVVEFTVAVNEKWTGKDGQEQERVTFVRCTAWKGMAEKVAAKFKKGDTIFVHGRLSLDEWEKDGVKMNKLFVTANVVTSPFYGGAESAPEPRPRWRRTPEPQPELSKLADDDVPF